MESDHPNRQFSATPSGSPPYNNTAQQANANLTSTYQSVYGSQHGSESSPPNNNRGFTYQGPYSYQYGTGASASTFNPPTYQRDYGQMVQPGPVHPHASNSGMALYKNGSGRMQPRSNNGIGPSIARPVNFGHGNDVLGHRKRQEPNGTRKVSEPKRVKRDSTEGENAQKVGDRDLQTTQPCYGAYSHEFNNPGQARIRVTMRQWTPPQDSHRAAPTTAIEMLPYVIKVYDAMVDTLSGFYDKVNAANRILNGRYPQEQVEATAWLIIVSRTSGKLAITP